jgi:hypothetical protein
MQLFAWIELVLVIRPSSRFSLLASIFFVFRSAVRWRIANSSVLVPFMASQTSQHL